MATIRSSTAVSLIRRSLTTSTQTPNSSPSRPFFNAASQSPQSLRRCPQCNRSYRAFSTQTRLKNVPKRLLMTESTGAYRPESLHTTPPPRNVGIPESSIAGGLRIDKNLLAKQDGQQETSRILDETVSEKEAQQSTPIPSQEASQASSAKSQPARKSRLRSRKAAMTLTAEAVAHVRDLLDQPEPKLIRVGVKNKGCSGSSYHLEYVDRPGAFDEMVEQDGVKVLIDSKALIKVIGSEMDWVEDKLSARFTFTNPNITEQCGCGESFSVT